MKTTRIKTLLCTAWGLGLALSLALGLTQGLQAQAPAPASAPSQPILIQGATLHLGTGQVGVGDLLISPQGIIEEVALGSSITRTGATIISARGQHVYPGFIALSTTLGLQEAEAIRATRDYAEVGDLNPHVRALIAYNCESEVIPTVRYNGILTAQIEPQGGLIPGRSSVMKLDCWNWEDGVIRADEGLHLNWPASLRPSNNPEDKEAPKRALERAKNLESLKTLLAEGKAWAAKPGSPANLKLAAMKGLYDSSLTCYVHLNSRGQILEAVDMLKAAGVKRLVLVGGSKAFYDTRDYLRGRSIPLIINLVHRLPGHPDEDIDLPYRLPALLTEQGFTVALGYSGEHWQSRNLPFQAGTTAGYGLNAEQALQLISRNPARILGLESQLGTLEKGKQATLFLSEGDALDMRSSRVVRAWISGREISLESRQTRLYDKYATKLGQKPVR